MSKDIAESNVSITAIPVPGDDRAYDVVIKHDDSHQKEFRIFAMRATTKKELESKEKK